MKRIVFTGGGSAGHVTPNIALFPKLKSMGYDIHYIGSCPQRLCRSQENIKNPQA